MKITYPIVNYIIKRHCIYWELLFVKRRRTISKKSLRTS